MHGTDEIVQDSAAGHRAFEFEEASEKTWLSRGEVLGLWLSKLWPGKDPKADVRPAIEGSGTRGPENHRV